MTKFLQNSTANSLLLPLVATAAVSSPNNLVLPAAHVRTQANKVLQVSLVVLTQNSFKIAAAPVTEVPSTWSEQPWKPQQYFSRNSPLTPHGAVPHVRPGVIQATNGQYETLTGTRRRPIYLDLEHYNAWPVCSQDTANFTGCRIACTSSCDVASAWYITVHADKRPVHYE